MKKSYERENLITIFAFEVVFKNKYNHILLQYPLENYRPTPFNPLRNCTGFLTY
jgi:hypothetical protein